MSIDGYLRTYLSNRPFFLSLIRAKEAELFSRYVPFTAPILDVGCGDGFFAHVIGEKKRSIDVGLDVEHSRQPEARKLGIYANLVTYNGKKFPFPSASFATVMSNCVLEHIPNLGQVVGEMYRVLVPGGTLVVSVMAKPWEDYLVGSMVMGNSYRHWMRKKQVHVHLLPVRDWTNVFTHAGFRVEKKIGYLSPAACRLIDVGHYVSWPSLFSYVLFKKWVLWKFLGSWYPVRWLTRVIGPDVPLHQAGAIFFVLIKP